VRVLKAADGEVLDLAFSPDGRAVAAAVEYHGVFLWNLAAATPSFVRLSAEGGYCKGGLSFSADGRSLAWLTIGGRRVYDRDAREFAEHSFAVTETTHAVAAGADGARVVSQHGMPDFCLIGWRADGGAWARDWTVSVADLSVSSLTLSPDGTRFALLARSALGGRWWEQPMRVEVRDAATAAVRGTGDYPYNYAKPLLFSPDARQLVGFNGMALLAWAVPELGASRTVQNDTRKHFTALAYHPSGRHLYATSNDETVHVFDAHTWERAGQFTWQLGELKAVAVSPDGTLAAAGGANGDVVIWDVDL
jgi:WD40 repeat protein